MYRHVQKLQGFSPRESFALRLGGVRLRAPSARLCDSNAKPYSLLSYELIALYGGSKVGDEPINDQSETQINLLGGIDAD